MKTVELSPAEMEARIARFARLVPMPAQQNSRIPLAARDLIYSRKLMPVISHQGPDAPLNVAAAPIRGAGGMTMTIAVCPPGTGPGLHAHHRTHETFTVLQGRFRFAYGDAGQHCAELDRFDVISIPPGVCRGFTNVSEEEGILQVLITGGVHDMNDIAFPPAMADRIRRIAPEALSEFEKLGLKFDAGVTP